MNELNSSALAALAAITAPSPSSSTTEPSTALSSSSSPSGTQLIPLTQLHDQSFHLHQSPQVIQHYTKRMQELGNDIKKCRGFKKCYQQLLLALDEIPKKLKHRVMIPFIRVPPASQTLAKRYTQSTLLHTPYTQLSSSSTTHSIPLAYIPGRLVDTNELTVSLGNNYFIHTSAYEAKQIVSRRIKYIDSKIDGLRHEMDRMKDTLIMSQLLNHQMRNGVTLNDERRANDADVDDDEIIEIREEYVSDEDVNDSNDVVQQNNLDTTHSVYANEQDHSNSNDNDNDAAATAVADDDVSAEAFAEIWKRLGEVEEEEKRFYQQQQQSHAVELEKKQAPTTHHAIQAEPESATTATLLSVSVNGNSELSGVDNGEQEVNAVRIPIRHPGDISRFMERQRTPPSSRATTPRESSTQDVKSNYAAGKVEEEQPAQPVSIMKPPATTHCDTSSSDSASTSSSRRSHASRKSVSFASDVLDNSDAINPLISPSMISENSKPATSVNNVNHPRASARTRAAASTSTSPSQQQNAFIGTIVERDDDTDVRRSTTSDQSPLQHLQSRPQKLSRFKQQRMHR